MCHIPVHHLHLDLHPHAQLQYIQYETHYFLQWQWIFALDSIDSLKTNQNRNSPHTYGSLSFLKQTVYSIRLRSGVAYCTHCYSLARQIRQSLLFIFPSTNEDDHLSLPHTHSASSKANFLAVYAKCVFYVCERLHWYRRSLKTCRETCPSPRCSPLTFLLVWSLNGDVYRPMTIQHLIEKYQLKVWMFFVFFCFFLDYREKKKKKVSVMSSAFQSARLTSFLCMCCVRTPALCPCVSVCLSAMLCCISPWWRWKATWRAALCQRKASVNI